MRLSLCSKSGSSVSEPMSMNSHFKNKNLTFLASTTFRGEPRKGMRWGEVVWGRKSVYRVWMHWLQKEVIFLSEWIENLFPFWFRLCRPFKTGTGYEFLICQEYINAHMCELLKTKPIDFFQCAMDRIRLLLLTNHYGNYIFIMLGSRISNHF